MPAMFYDAVKCLFTSILFINTDLYFWNKLCFLVMIHTSCCWKHKAATKSDFHYWSTWWSPPWINCLDFRFISGSKIRGVTPQHSFSPNIALCPRDPVMTANTSSAPTLPVSGTRRGHVSLMRCHISVLDQCITQMNISVRWGKVMFWCNYHLLLPVIVSDLFGTIISWWTSGTELSSLFIVLHSGKTQLNWGVSY